MRKQIYKIKVKNVKGVYTFESDNFTITVNIPDRRILLKGGIEKKEYYRFNNVRFSIESSEVNVPRWKYDYLLIFYKTAYNNISIPTDESQWKKIEGIDRIFALKKIFPDLIVNPSYDIPMGKIPKGFIKYCLETHTVFTRSSLILWKEAKECQTFPKDVRELALRNSCLFGKTYYDRDVRIKLLRKLKDKNNLDCSMSVLNTLEWVSRFPELKEILFDTHTFEENYPKIREAYYIIKDREIESLIIKQQEKILNIENTESDSYCIVCPRNLKDLLAEGRQQNNCVGHTYNDRVAAGEDYIYFIRKKSNKKKSFITCRYDVEECRTVEARAVNNTDVPDDEELYGIIDRIDNFIIRIK